MANGERRRSAFTWNAGGWFGGQIGGTLWLGILGVLTVARDAVAGGLALGTCLLLNGIGVAFWRARSRVSAYAALQLFLALVAVAATAVVLTFLARGLGGPEPAGKLVSTELPLGVLLVFPGLMLFFYLRERTERRARTRRTD